MGTGRPKDKAWDYVEKEPNGWKCPYCQRSFPGGASRIKAHLLGITGQGIIACQNISNIPDNVKHAISDNVNVGSTSNPARVENETPFPEGDLASECHVNLHSNTAFECMNKLSKELKHLICQAKDIEEQLNFVELQNGKKRKREVDYWLSEVESIKKRFADLKKLVDQSVLKPKIQQLIEEVTEHKKLKPCEGSLTLDVPTVECAEPLLLVTEKLVGQNLQSNIGKICELLNDENVKIIGVHGMGGAGKTTLVTHIHDEIAKGVNIFSSVFWITVSQNFSIFKLQSDIAKRINLNLDEECDERIRASRLRQALAEKKRSVLILDNVWKKIDLNRVGVPLEKGGVKLILTSHSLEVCRRTGCASNDDIIKVELLSDEEAWQLFLLHLGMHETFPSLDPEVLEVARRVARECNGLPLGIKVLATTMKSYTTIYEWRHALTELQNSRSIEQDVEEEVFRILRFSYDRLNDTKLQKCFLCCSLYPEDSKINCDELIGKFVHEKLIDEGEIFGKYYDEGQSILRKLVSCCLLEDCEDDGIRCVKMHDLLRDMDCRIRRY